MPKISALTADTTVTTDDLIPVVDMAGPTTKKITVDNFRIAVFAGSGMTATPLSGVTSITTTLGIGVGVAVSTSRAINVTGTTVLTAGASQYGMYMGPTFTSASTTAGYGVYVVATTAAAAFTQTNTYGLYVDNGSAGAGSTITNLYGVYVVRQTAGGTLNYGVRIAGGSTRGLLIDADGATITAGGLTVTAGGVTVTADGLTVTAGGLTVTAGNIGIGTAVAVDKGLRINGSILATSATQYGMLVDPTASSAATTSVRAIQGQVRTAAAAFTVTDAYGCYVSNANIGATSAITNQYGIYVETMSGAASINYGIYIAGGTPALFINGGGIQINSGTAGVGIGASPTAARGVIIGSSLTGATSQYGIYANGSFGSGGTTAGYGAYFGMTTAAAAFVQTDFYGIYVDAVAKGAGSTITNRYGIFVVQPTDGGTLNIGIQISAAAVPATAGAVAAGMPIRLYSTGLSVEATSDTPTHTRVKGSICINTGGSSTSTRMYVNTDGAGTWASFTTSA